MNQRNDTGTKRSKWAYALALLWLAACGGAVGTPSVGGESHFLRHCGDGCGPGLECVSDVCTRACRVDTNDCTDLAGGAKCTNASIEPGELAVCDLACEDAAGCRALGSDYTCESGFCRGPVPSNPGGAGAGSVGGTSTSGGSSSAGGTGGTGGGAPVPNRCSLPFEAGPCEAAFQVFAFEGGQCVPKTYGGCEGNGNRFETLAACESACGDDPEPVPAARCLLPFEQGPCDAAFSVFAFEGGQCVPKTYGGCEGNGNRFDMLEQCLSACEGRPASEPCPAGRVAQEICLECGPAGGCAERATVCAQPCDALEPGVCGVAQSCFNGYCQVGPCF